MHGVVLGEQIVELGLVIVPVGSYHAAVKFEPPLTFALLTVICWLASCPQFVAPLGYVHAGFAPGT